MRTRNRRIKDPAMPERPLTYMSRYKPVQFAGCGSQGQKYIHLNAYISGDVMAGESFRKKAYLDIKRFIHGTDRYAGGKHGAADHTYFTDTAFLVAPSIKPIPFHYCPWDDVRQAFQGKGTPVRFARALKLCDYYLQRADIDIAKLGWGRRVTDLQEYADYYIGLDCNGFVGAYLEDNLPGSGVVGNIDIDSIGNYYKDKTSGTHFTRIDDPKLIKRSDILVRRKVSSDPSAVTRHIALVEDVIGTPTSSSVKLLLAESTGGSGLSSRTETLTKITKNSRDRNWKLGTREYDAVIRSQ
jgi:hypothetical protein